jgi:UDP-N-acetylmuramate--alanine ligase
VSISNSSYGKDKIKELLKGGGRLHFVGASGAGMAPLAELCLMRGVSVSGSDIHPAEAYRRLTERGARLYPVHNADAVGDAAALVYSLAVPEDNEEIASARK